MKKIFIILIVLFGSITNINADIERIVSGNENAKITIIVYESLTCSHCASFHKDIYPLLKKEYIDTSLAKKVLNWNSNFLNIDSLDNSYDNFIENRFQNDTSPHKKKINNFILKNISFLI